MVNAEGFAPEIETPLIVRGALPVLFNDTVWTALVVPTVWLLKFRLEGERVAERPEIPLPLSFTVCGLLAALSVNVIVPVLVPAAVGVKVTLTVQLVPPASPLPQALFAAKAKSPLAAMLVKVSAALPVLAAMIGIDWLVPPTPSSGKLTFNVDRLKPGASVGLILATNASPFVLPTSWNAAGVTSRLVEGVNPATYTLPAASRAIPRPSSKFPPTAPT
jgi:hypothetical protein